MNASFVQLENSVSYRQSTTDARCGFFPRFCVGSSLCRDTPGVYCRSGACLSIKIMSQVWELQTETHTEKLVLLALADNANDQGWCWPSIPTVARKCQLTERSVQEQLRKFEAKNPPWLITKQRPGHSSTYTIKLPTPEPCSPLPLNKVHPAPEHRSPPPLNRVHPEPSVEPSKNRHYPERASFLKEVSELIAEIGVAVFARKENQRPSRAEEEAALQIVQRPDWKAEKDEILVFNRIVAHDERRFEIPKTLFKLLDEWDQTLDKARNYRRPAPPGSKGGESVKDRNARLEMASALRAIAISDELTKNL